MNLGNALLAQGNARDAITHYEEVLRIHPDDAQTHGNLGAALVKLGRPQEAIQHCEEAIRLKPDDPEAHYNLGIALRQADRLQEAMEQWEQVLRLKPDEVDAHYNLGLALEKMGRSAEAIDHYKQALTIRPDFTPASNALQRLEAGSEKPVVVSLSVPKDSNFIGMARSREKQFDRAASERLSLPSISEDYPWLKTNDHQKR